MKGTMIRKDAYSFKTSSKKERGGYFPMSSSFAKKGGLIREFRITGSPLYVPLGPLAPDPLNPIPLKVPRSHLQVPLRSGLPEDDVREDFVKNHVEPYLVVTCSRATMSNCISF